MSRYSGVNEALRSVWAELRPRAVFESVDEDAEGAAREGLAEREVEATPLPEALPIDARSGLTAASFVILPAKAVVTGNE